MASGSAVRFAVGAGVVDAAVGPRLDGLTGFVFLWHPATAATASASNKALRTDLIRIDCDLITCVSGIDFSCGTKTASLLMLLKINIADGVVPGDVPSVGSAKRG